MIGFTVQDGVVALCVIFVMSRMYWYDANLKRVNYMPGIRCMFGTMSLLGTVLPSTWWNPGQMFTWRRRFELYKTFRSETISVVPGLAGDPIFYTSSLEVARQVTSGAKSDWTKPEAASRGVAKWGPNVFTLPDNEAWHRHRRIVTPAFNPRMYAKVWDEAIATYQDMVATEQWLDAEVVDIPTIEKYFTKFTFLVFCICGFGLQSSWSAPLVDGKDSSEEMSLAEAILVDSINWPLQLFPKWIKSLPFDRIKKANAAHKIMDKYLREQTAERKEVVRAQIAANEEGASDAFSLLVRANELDDTTAQGGRSSGKLSDEELRGNVFILLFAGHETTSRTLTAVFAYLAGYQDIQEDVYQQILDVVGTESVPKMEQFAKLDKVLAVFYEASRMYPTGYVLIREAIKDTELVISDSPGTPGGATVPVPKGMWMAVDMVGLNYNPAHFSEPEKFKPERWLPGGENSFERAESVLSFSFGPRVCPGRKFAATEAVALITMWLRDFKIEPLLAPGQTVENWREIVFDAHWSITLGIKTVPIRLRRRT